MAGKITKNFIFKISKLGSVISTEITLPFAFARLLNPPFRVWRLKLHPCRATWLKRHPFHPCEFNCKFAALSRVRQEIGRPRQNICSPLFTYCTLSLKITHICTSKSRPTQVFLCNETKCRHRFSVGKKDRPVERRQRAQVVNASLHRLRRTGSSRSTVSSTTKRKRWWIVYSNGQWLNIRVRWVGTCWSNHVY